MKRKLMKYAMLMIADEIEDAFPGVDMTVEEFIRISCIEFEYWETTEGSRIDAHLMITQDGEKDTQIDMCIAR